MNVILLWALFCLEGGGGGGEGNAPFPQPPFTQMGGFFSPFWVGGVVGRVRVQLHVPKLHVPKLVWF